MNTKAEQSKGVNAADIGKLVLAVLVLAGGIFAYSWFGNDGGVPQAVRFLGVLVALLVALAIGAFTGPGRRVRGFLAESQFEMRKVVWPTRKEAGQTTLVVFGFVLVMALCIWGSDKTIEWIVFSLILGWK